MARASPALDVILSAAKDLLLTIRLCRRAHRIAAPSLAVILRSAATKDLSSIPSSCHHLQSS
jgi:hypothetical protein